MVLRGAAAARRRLARAAARAVAIAHRKRRDSHRGYPDLHQTHRVPIGGSAPLAAFPDTGLPITFRFRIDASATSGVGLHVGLGDQGEIGVCSRMLWIVTGQTLFLGDFAGEPAESAEVVVSLRPPTRDVRAWVDSRCVIAGKTLQDPHSWAMTGSVTYDAPEAVPATDDLDVFYDQIPRHFDECTEEGSRMQATLTKFLSESHLDKGGPINCTTTATLVHTVPADTVAELDRITLFASNALAVNITVEVSWGTGPSNKLRFECPSTMTVPLVVDMPLGPEETVMVRATSGQVQVFGRVERVPA